MPQTPHGIRLTPSPAESSLFHASAWAGHRLLPRAPLPPQQIMGTEIPASGSASRELVLSSIVTFLLHNLCHSWNFTLPSVLLCLIFAFPLDCELLCSLFFFCFNLYFPRTEEPRRLQSKGSQRAGHNWVTSQTAYIYFVCGELNTVHSFEVICLFCQMFLSLIFLENLSVI